MCDVRGALFDVSFFFSNRNLFRVFLSLIVACSFPKLSSDPSKVSEFGEYKVIPLYSVF